MSLAGRRGLSFVAVALMFLVLGTMALAKETFSQTDILSMAEGIPMPQALVRDLIRIFAGREPPATYVARAESWTALLVLRPFSESAPAADRHMAIRRCENVAFAQLVREVLAATSSDVRMPLEEGRYAALLGTLAVRRMRVEIEGEHWLRSGVDKEWVWALLAVPDAHVRACEARMREIPESELRAAYLEEVQSRAEALASQGAFDDAIPWFEEAIRLLGRAASNEYLLRYARVAAGAGQHKKAEDALRALNIMRSRDLSAQHWDIMGDLYDALGNSAEASMCYERALSLQPPPSLTVDTPVAPR